jgi:glycerol-3-phosphate dehydrogenase
MLPWQGAAIVGTTDAEMPLTNQPAARDSEVAFILDAVADFLSVPVRGLVKHSAIVVHASACLRALLPWLPMFAI